MLEKVLKIGERALAASALTVTKASADSYCAFLMYEPELPKGAERLKKQSKKAK